MAGGEMRGELLDLALDALEGSSEKGSGAERSGRDGNIRS
jgi:hypothetical protein